MEAGVSIAGIINLARLVGAWMVLTTLVFAFSLQLLTQQREFRTATWRAAGFCGRAADN